jgi:hypothetical protein
MKKATCWLVKPQRREEVFGILDGVINDPQSTPLNIDCKLDLVATQEGDTGEQEVKRKGWKDLLAG